jgi:hypothetical protein
MLCYYAVPFTWFILQRRNYWLPCVISISASRSLWRVGSQYPSEVFMQCSHKCIKLFNCKEIYKAVAIYVAPVCLCFHFDR